MPRNDKTVFVSFRVDEKTRALLQNLAEERDESISHVLRRAVRRYQRFMERRRAAGAAQAPAPAQRKRQRVAR